MRHLPSRRPRGGRILCLGGALAALVILGAGGCEEPDSVILDLSADFQVGGQLTELEVSIAASGSPEGEPVCTPFTYLFNLDPNASAYVELPLSIRVKPGADYDRILYVRVRGYLKGMLRLKMERMVSLRGGEVRLPLELLEECLGVATGRSQHCVNGAVVQSPYWPIFEGLVDTESTPCVK